VAGNPEGKPDNEIAVFEFLVGPVVAMQTEQDVVESDDELQRHADFQEIWQRRVETVSVSEPDLAKFWRTKVIPLAQTLTTGAKDTLTGYEIDEIEFTIGVGIGGGLAFVAQASANAQVSVTVRKKREGTG
jgi:hypothetical protein